MPIDTFSDSSKLRDLSDEAFKTKYQTDRFTAALLNKRMTYIVQHMATAFLRQAFSPIVSQWYDFSCTISGPPEQGYPVPAVSDGLLVFVGTMCDAVRTTVEEYGVGNLVEGDVLIANDPYRTGCHVNDLVFIRPVFHENRVIAFVSMRVHQLDIGGVAPGGFSLLKKDVYENGLVIPPMLLFSGGKPVKSTFSLLFENTRFGVLIKPDIFSTFSQLSFGERLIHENVRQYGLAAFHGSMRYATDASAEIMREAIAALPDGDYVGTHHLDADGIDDSEDLLVSITLRKRGEKIEADLSGSSRQARTCLNASYICSKNAVGCALSMLLAPGVQFTSGNWRDIDVTAPPGTVGSALPPNGVVFYHWEVAGAIVAAVFKALNPVLGDGAMAGDHGSSNTHNGTGRWPDGRIWACIGQAGGEHGPWGATVAGDGDSYNVTMMLNCILPGIEPVEAEAPVVILSNEIEPDTGGGGFNRGGMAIRRETYWLREGRHFVAPLHCRKPSGFGANGGLDGSLAAAWYFPPEVARIDERRSHLPLTADVYANSEPIAGLLDPDTKAPGGPNPRYFHYASRPEWALPPGSIMRVLTNGAGGWGDPLGRLPERVLRDVRNGYVTIEGARHTYGIVVLGDPDGDPEGLAVDEEATRHIRSGNLLQSSEARQ